MGAWKTAPGRFSGFNQTPECGPCLGSLDRMGIDLAAMLVARSRLAIAHPIAGLLLRFAPRTQLSSRMACLRCRPRGPCRVIPRSRASRRRRSIGRFRSRKTVSRGSKRSGLGRSIAVGHNSGRRRITILLPRRNSGLSIGRRRRPSTRNIGLRPSRSIARHQFRNSGPSRSIGRHLFRNSGLSRSIGRHRSRNSGLSRSTVQRPSSSTGRHRSRSRGPSRSIVLRQFRNSGPSLNIGPRRSRGRLLRLARCRSHELLNRGLRPNNGERRPLGIGNIGRVVVQEVVECPGLIRDPGISLFGS